MIMPLMRTKTKGGGRFLVPSSSAKFRRLMAALLAACSLLSSSTIFASAAAAATPSFPFHRCSDYAATSLPYELTVPVERQHGTYCMNFTYKGMVSNPSTCYSILSTLGGSRLTLGVGESDRLCMDGVALVRSKADPQIMGQSAHNLHTGDIQT